MIMHVECQEKMHLLVRKNRKNLITIDCRRQFSIEQ
jgi:hypothetical protein